MKNKRSQEETESASDKRPTEPVAKAVHDFFLERWTNNLIGVQIWIGTPPFKRQWTHSPPDPLVRDKNPPPLQSNQLWLLDYVFGKRHKSWWAIQASWVFQKKN